MVIDNYEGGICMSVEFTGKKACIAPEGVFIIGTYDENGVPNAMNAAWGAQSDYDEITLFLAFQTVPCPCGVSLFRRGI